VIFDTSLLGNLFYSFLKAVFVNMLLLVDVDFRSRMLAFRGACGEPPQRFAPLGVSPVPLIPQESRTLLSNQLVKKPTQ
jgi:hypothetical protein